MTGSPFFFSAVNVSAGSAPDPYPVILSATPTSFNTNATAHLVTMPPTVNTGELILVLWGNDGGATVSQSGFTEVYWVNYTTNMSIGVYARISDGTEDGTTVDFVTSGSENAGAIVLRISNWHGTIATDIVVSTATFVASTSNPNPPALTSGFGAVPTLWISHLIFSAATTVDTIPSGYTALGTAGNNTGTTNCMLVPGWITNSNASEDPGTYAYSVAAGAVMVTIAVRGTA